MSILAARYGGYELLASDGWPNDKPMNEEGIMNQHVIATLVGILLQVGGAGYLVFHARCTSDVLAKYKSNVTYDNFAQAIDDLAHELHAQYGLQMRGFMALAAGSALQFYGAIPA